MEVLHIDGVYSRILCGIFQMIYIALELCNIRNQGCLLINEFLKMVSTCLLKWNHCTDEME